MAQLFSLGIAATSYSDSIWRPMITAIISARLKSVSVFGHGIENSSHHASIAGDLPAGMNGLLGSCIILFVCC